jgi:outer membrane protein OmpA-like peptidoglycan-associated protein
MIKGLKSLSRQKRRQGMHHLVWVAGAVLIMTGCATKGFVNETVSKQRTEVDQRIDKVEGEVSTGSQRLGTVEGKVTDQAQRVEAVGSRVGAVETSVGQAATAARDAQERANGAMARADSATTRADEVDGRLTRLWGNRHARNVVSTSEVRFRSGKADLNDEAQTALIGLVKEMKENPLLVVELEGYADPSGSPDQNVVLSQRRADAVRRFLVQQGVDQSRIHAIGLGPITDRSMPSAEKRRVAVKVLALAS